MINYKFQFFFILGIVILWFCSYTKYQDYKSATIKMDISYMPGVSTSLIFLNFKILDTANNHIFKLQRDIKYIAVSFILNLSEVIWIPIIQTLNRITMWLLKVIL